MAEAVSAALRLEDLHKSFGRTDIIRGVTLDVRRGRTACHHRAPTAPENPPSSIWSADECGPTRGQIFLDQRPDRGTCAVSDQTVSDCPRSFQITNVFPKLSVFENIRCAVLWRAAPGLLAVGAVLKRARTRSMNVCWEVLDSIDPPRSSRQPWAESLSYAEMRALELGLTIAGDARVVLLDEPMAGMSRTEGARALELIRRISVGRTLLLVEHDMTVGVRDRRPDFGAGLRPDPCNRNAGAKSAATSPCRKPIWGQGRTPRRGWFS